MVRQILQELVSELLVGLKHENDHSLVALVHEELVWFDLRVI